MSIWKVFYILDTEEEVIEIAAESDQNARRLAQRNFGSPIEITQVRQA